MMSSKIMIVKYNIEVRIGFGNAAVKVVAIEFVVRFDNLCRCTVGGRINRGGNRRR